MKLKLIGKIDGLPLFEVSEEKYIAVDTESGKHLEMWTWYGQLGRNFDTFEKCSNCENETVALEMIEMNKRAGSVK